MKHTTFFIAASLFAFTAAPLAAQAQSPKMEALTVRYKAITNAKTKRYNMKVVVPTFSGNEPVVESASENIAAFAYGMIDDFAKENAGLSDDVRAKISMELKPTVSMARTDLISVYFTEIADTLGAHAYGGHTTHSFGVTKDGARKLELRDLFEPDADPDTIVLSVVTKELEKKGISPEEFGKKMSPDTLKSWVITPAGITVFFDAGTLNSYAAGDYIAKCSWAELDKVTEAGRLSAFARKISGIKR